MDEQENGIIELTPALANKAEAEKVVGRRLPDELFEMDQIWGRRILVVREVSDSWFGRIYLPNPAREFKTTGWVIAAGPLVGTPAPGAPGWSPFYASELLLRKVLFGAWSGTEMPITEDPLKKSDEEFAKGVEDGEEEDSRVIDRPYIVMNDLDVFWSY